MNVYWVYSMINLLNKRTWYKSGKRLEINQIHTIRYFCANFVKMIQNIFYIKNGNDDLGFDYNTKTKHSHVWLMLVPKKA